MVSPIVFISFLFNLFINVLFLIINSSLQHVECSLSHHFPDDGDLYEALAEMLSKKHVTDTELDLEAISHGDFRDVPQGLYAAFLLNPLNLNKL